MREGPDDAERIIYFRWPARGLWQIGLVMLLFSPERERAKSERYKPESG
jgi:hypothetical protein